MTLPMARCDLAFSESLPSPWPGVKAARRAQTVGLWHQAESQECVLNDRSRCEDKGKLCDEVPTRAARRRRQRLYKTSWVVYAKSPFGGPEQIFSYLGRYTHRVAISNARLVTLDDKAVVFRTRGSDTASLPPTEFIGRFLQHILPSGFVKIRHFGLVSSGNVHRRLEQAFAALSPVTSDPAKAASDASDDGDDVELARPIDPNLPWPALLLALTGQDVLRCPRCQQRMIVRLLMITTPICWLRIGAAFLAKAAVRPGYPQSSRTTNA